MKRLFPILFKNAVNTLGFGGSYLQTGWIVTASTRSPG
jgi:hypothetical protein